MALSPEPKSVSAFLMLSRPYTQAPAVVLMVGLLLSIGVMHTLDQALMPVLRDIPAWSHKVVRFFSRLGEGTIVIVVSALVWLAALVIVPIPTRRRAKAAWTALRDSAGFVLLAVSLGGLVASLLKNSIGRSRPRLAETLGGIQYNFFAFDAASASFPSGHSATAGAMSIALALLFPRWRWPLIAVGLGICLSRPMLGAHWASDTIFGWTVGVAVTLIIAHRFARKGAVFRHAPTGALTRRERGGTGRLMRRTRLLLLTAIVLIGPAARRIIAGLRRGLSHAGAFIVRPMAERPGA